MLDVGYQGKDYRLPLVVLDGTGPLLFGRNWLHQIQLNWQTICSMSEKTDVGAVVDRFPEVFQDDVGCARNAEVSIPVDESAQPIFFKPRTVPLAYKSQVDAELDRQIKAGLLVPVTNVTFFSLVYHTKEVLKIATQEDQTKKTKQSII